MAPLSILKKTQPCRVWPRLTTGAGRAENALLNSVVAWIWFGTGPRGARTSSARSWPSSGCRRRPRRRGRRSRSWRPHRVACGPRHVPRPAGHPEPVPENRVRQGLVDRHVVRFGVAVRRRSVVVGAAGTSRWCALVVVGAVRPWPRRPCRPSRPSWPCRLRRRERSGRPSRATPRCTPRARRRGRRGRRRRGVADARRGRSMGGRRRGQKFSSPAQHDRAHRC